MKNPAMLAGVVILALISIVTGAYFYRHQSTQDKLLPHSVPRTLNTGNDVIGKPRPGFALPDLSGNTRDINEWSGKVLVINFWATWCPPCLKEVPEFVELQKKYGDRGLQFVGIALQKPEEVVEFAREHAMNYPVLTGEMAVITVAQSYGNTQGALPYTAVIDRAGVIRYTKIGQMPGTRLEALIQPLL